MTEKRFRFQDFEIWKDSIELTKKILLVTNDLEDAKNFAFADQLRRAVLSISNNIAEGSGSDSKKDFNHFLTIAKRSAFECANIILVLDQLNQINDAQEILNSLERISCNS
jgi:four helix bundle protein